MKPYKTHKSIRLKGYDYNQDGWYFITICSHNFDELFGIINENEEMLLNEIGQIIDFQWKKSEEMRPKLNLDIYQIMPNHFHGIFIFGDKNILPDIKTFPDTSSKTATFKSPKDTIGSFIRGFKTASTSEALKLYPKQYEKIWQFNFYERIIRNVKELENIRKYIKNNPKNWLKDKEHFKKLLLKMQSK